jgi:ComF family protein
MQVCPQCEKIFTDKGQRCDYCRKDRASLDNLIVATHYNEHNLSKLVHLYKYNFAENLHLPLGRLLVNILLKNNLPLPDFIVPVPLHPRRLRWRGFNQAELLANFVAQNLTPGFPIPVVTDLLQRQKYTPPQMQIGKYDDRRKNMLEAFTINKKSNHFGQLQHSNNYSFLLIDDIATTGSTLFECAKILKQNGAKKVLGAVIARQEFS